MGRQQRRRTERRQAERKRRKQAPPKRSNTSLLVGGAVIILAVIAAIGFGVSRSGQGASPTPTEQALAAPVDGIGCDTTEALVYHIHQHLTMYDHGRQVLLPSSIGIPGSEANPTCFYWLHVHALYPGIIHVESPSQRIYTLGQFFDVWKATKNDAIPPGDAYVLKLQQAAARGDVTVFVENRRWNRGYRSVPLTSRESITVEIGKPIVPPTVFHNWDGL